MAQQDVTLNPGESKTISFAVTPTVAKTYSVSVDGLSGSFVATTVPVADIRLSNLVISPTEVNVQQSVMISIQATNYGGASGIKTITLSGDFTGQQSVSLNPGQSKTASFVVTPTLVKTYHVTIDGLSGSFKAIAPPPGIVTVVIAGMVTNAQTGQRVANVEVRCGSQVAYTNISGWFSFYNVPLGSYTVTFTATGFATGSRTGVLTEDTELDIALVPIGQGICHIDKITVYSKGGTSSAPPVVNETAVIFVTVSNWSGLTASYHLDIYVGGLQIQSWSSTLPHGGRTGPSGGFYPKTAGIYTAKADLDYGREVLTKDFEVLPA